MHNSDLFYGVGEVAALLKVCPQRVYLLAAQGRIPSVKFGRRVLIPRHAWDEYWAQMSSAALARCGRGAAGEVAERAAAS